jgi:hypothetical protein
MDAQTWVAVIAAVIAAAALYSSLLSTKAAQKAASATKEQADATKEQTEIQRQLRIDAAQPYVWADIRQDSEAGILLNLVVGNSGPTVAKNVRVQIEPPLPTIEQLKESAIAQERLASGISSLPPGRIHTWLLGQGFNLLSENGPQRHTFTVYADGPFGPVPPVSYIVDLADWRGQVARAAGSLNQISNAIEGLARKIEAVGRQATLAAHADVNSGPRPEKAIRPGRRRPDHSDLRRLIRRSRQPNG